MERSLYQRGMSLGAAKTSIRRAPNTLLDFRAPGDEIDESLQAMLDAVGEYGPSDADVEDARVELLREMFDGAVAALWQDRYPRRELVASLRGLSAVKDGHATSELPYVVTRMPGLMAEAMNYLSKMRSDEADAVAGALGQIIEQTFHRDQEWVHILRAAIRVTNRRLSGHATRFGELAMAHPAPLVRARALLAWGRHSPPEEIELADRFFQRERRMWLGYAIASVKDKTPSVRSEAYRRWSSEGRTINRVIASLEETALSWGHM